MKLDKTGKNIVKIGFYIFSCITLFLVGSIIEAKEPRIVSLLPLIVVATFCVTLFGGLAFFTEEEK